MKQANLYFIAIIPPEPINGEAESIKKIFADEYQSKGAMKSPPHITLHMPFKLKSEKENELIKTLTELAKCLSSFELILNGFGQFKERIIYISVEENDLLHRLFLEIRKSMKIGYNIFNADYNNRGFNPHMTVAFRDLKNQAFKAAWPLFEQKEFIESFSVNSFSLLKHNGSTWDVIEEFKFD